MSRSARIVIPGVPHHLTQRGNNRQPVFFTDADRRAYLALLNERADTVGLRVLGYCLMTNHVQWCRNHRHLPVGEQHQTLSQKLRGHYAYYGITGNAAALSRFREAVTDLWRKWLGRRHRAASLWWSRFARLLKRYPLPAVAVVHSAYRPAAKR